MAITIITTGLIISGVYALLSIGFSLIFGVARILNLAQTAFYMLSSYMTFYLSVNLGLNILPASIASIAVVTAIGYFIYRFCIKQISEHETAVLLVTITLALIFQEFIILKYGFYQKTVPPIVSGYVDIYDARISYQHVLALFITGVVLYGIWFLLRKTRFGLAIRAVSQDREIANLMGIEVRRVCLLTFTLATFIAALAGVILAPLYSLEPFMWTHPLLMICAIVVLGGMGSVFGGVVGSFVMGYAETLVVFFIPGGSYLKTAIALLIMIVILLVRPEGMFGVTSEKERL